MRIRLVERLPDFTELPNTGDAGGVMFNLKDFSLLLDALFYLEPNESQIIILADKPHPEFNNYA